MTRRWSMGAMTAVLLAIVSALTVAGMGVGPTQWALRLSPSGVELSATSQHVSVALTL
jgi:hypothetical protein